MNFINKSIKSVFFGMLASLVLVFAVFSLAQTASAQATSTVVVTAMVCDQESDLPNLGLGLVNIDENTATDWIAQSNGGCQLAEGWEFEWATADELNPGNHLDYAGSPWTTFGPTDGDGQTTVVVPVPEDGLNRVWIREVFQDGYVPFSGDVEEPLDDNISAELYCHNDITFYDNFDYVFFGSTVGVADSQTYYCVAFNVLEEEAINSVVADNQDISTEENTPLSIILTGYDYLNPSSVLTFTVLTNTTNGTLGAMNASNTVVYTPNTDYAGPDSFDFEVCDANSNCSQGTVNITVSDIPDITLNGSSVVNITIGGTYTELGASCDDNEDGIFAATQAGDVVNVNTIGTYVITYQCTDYDGLQSPIVTRTVNVINIGVSNNAPVITLNGSAIVNIPIGGGAYTELGASCNDVEDGIFAADYNTTVVDVNRIGAYVISYQCTDDDGLKSPLIIRTVNVIPSNDAPVITLNGPSTVDVTTGGTYTEQGASCSDTEDGVITVVTTGTVDVNTAGAYTVTYICTDSDGNTDQEVRTVNIVNPTNGGGGGGGSSGGSSSTTSSGSIPTVVLTTTSSSAPVGQVLGAETGCGIYMTKYVRMGYVNDVAEVTKLQLFLNQHMNANIAVTGFFDSTTDKAVRDFQVKYADDILKPWNINSSTGLVYQTTITKINNIMCSSLNLPIPTNLVDWVNNPDTQKTR